MKALIISIIIIGIINGYNGDIYSDLVREQWNSYKLEFDKTYYGEIEENFRYKIFIKNLQRIAEHNQKYELGHYTYKLGINQFTDTTEHELQNSIPKLNIQELNNNLITHPITSAHSSSIQQQQQQHQQQHQHSLPDSINWVEKGAVTEIKDQGNCSGAGYAFAAIAALESKHFQITNELITLSEQNVIDCSILNGNEGCQRGQVVYAFNYIITNRGIDTESSYPYNGFQNKDCKYNSGTKGATQKQYVELINGLHNGNETQLKEVIATEGTVAVIIDASHQSFRMYKEGIYYEPDCDEENPNHSVLIVGYGIDDGIEYWLVKNSWGKHWGENGYIRVARNRNNNCCISCFGIYPVI